MDRLRAAVVGTGVWGEKHLQALKTIPEVEVVALCDVDQRRVRKIASQYQVQKVYNNFKELFDHEDLDLVHIVTPEPAHRRPVLEAASRGVHILVEKPLATSLEDADSMIEATRRHKVIMMVGHVLRWDTRYAMVKDAIERGEIGEIVSIFARRSVSSAQAPIFLPRSTPMMQLGIHDIDLILWYTESRVKRTYAHSTRLFDYKYPDTTACMLNLENGAHAVLQNSFSLPKTLPFIVGARMEIVGSKSFVVIDASEQTLFICDGKGWRTPDTTLIPVVRNNLVGSLRDEIEYFIDCVANGREPRVISTIESREALKVALACEKSMLEGIPTTVSAD